MCLFTRFCTLKISSPRVPVAAGSRTIHLLRMWVRIPPGAWMFVCCECCQVEVSATSWSLVQRSPTDCGASLCVIEKPREWGGTGPLGGGGAFASKTNKISSPNRSSVIVKMVTFNKQSCMVATFVIFGCTKRTIFRKAVNISKRYYHISFQNPTISGI